MRGGLGRAAFGDRYDDLRGLAGAIKQHTLDNLDWYLERFIERAEAAGVRVHFAVDDSEVEMCTELASKRSWFLPFNKGYNDGAGNPPNPRGLKTDYLWKEVLTPAGLTDILENKKEKLVFIRADEEAKYEAVMAAMDQLRVAAVEDVALITSSHQGGQ